MNTDLFELDSYIIRRKILKVVGASFHIFHQDEIVGFTNQKAFKLKEDIRVYRDESMGEELLSIKARQVIDFSAAYDIVDAPMSKKLGAARRRGLRSFVRDSWEVLNDRDEPVGEVTEDSAFKAMIRRLLANFVPQTFHLTCGQGEHVTLKQHWNPFVFRLEVSIPKDCPLDRRMILGTAILIAAIEGRQG